MLWFAMGLTLAYAGVEAAIGWWAGSLALVADAGHMVNDAGALALAAAAAWVAKLPPSRLHSYGMGRAEFMAVRARCAERDRAVGDGACRPASHASRTLRHRARHAAARTRRACPSVVTTKQRARRKPAKSCLNRPNQAHPRKRPSIARQSNPCAGALFDAARQHDGTRTLRECGAVDSNQDARGVLGGYFSRVNREPRRNLAILEPTLTVKELFLVITAAGNSRDLQERSDLDAF
jgi:Cation efflux family